MLNEKEKEKLKFAIAAYCNDLCHKLVVGHVTLYLSKVNRGEGYAAQKFGFPYRVSLEFGHIYGRNP